MRINKKPKKKKKKKSPRRIPTPEPTYDPTEEMTEEEVHKYFGSDAKKDFFTIFRKLEIQVRRTTGANRNRIRNRNFPDHTASLVEKHHTC